MIDLRSYAIRLQGCIIQIKLKVSIMKIKRNYIQYWDQPEQKADTLYYGTYCNPSKGNVRIGKKEIKWYNQKFK